MTKEFHFSCPRTRPQVGLSHHGLRPQPAPALTPQALPEAWDGTGGGLSTYLALLMKTRRLLRGEASILCCCLSLGPPEAAGSAGVGQQSCFPVPLQALRIGGCQGRGKRGHEAGEEDAAVWVLADLVLAQNRKQLKALLPGLWCRWGGLAATLPSALHIRERHPPQLAASFFFFFFGLAA